MYILICFNPFISVCDFIFLFLYFPNILIFFFFFILFCLLLFFLSSIVCHFYVYLILDFCLRFSVL